MPASTRLMARLAWRNLRHRPGQALLLLLVLCLATSTLSVALALNGTGARDWERVWRATNGPHVEGAFAYRTEGQPPEAELTRARAALAALATAPGVVAASGPWQALVTTGQVGRDRMELEVLIRDSAPAAVGQPLVTAGSWLGDGDGVVLEEGLASTLGVRPGDSVTVGGQALPVRGVAMDAVHGRFPMYEPGRVYVDGPTGARIAAAGAVEFGYSVELRLARAEDAAAFVAAQAGPPPERGDGVLIGLSTWEELRDGTHEDLTVFAVALLGIGILLAGLSVATAAVLVAGRMAAQIRQVGTLKAVGVTPGQVTGVLLAEYLSLAAAASVVGLAAGQLLAPRIAGAAASLYTAPQAPPVTWGRAATIVAVAAAVVVLATVRPALRGARQSTLRSLAATVRPPRRASRTARLAGRLGLPLPAVLGLRSAGRRPGRVIANAIGLTLGVAMVVIGLAFDTAIRHFRQEQPPFEPGTAGARVADQVLDQLVNVVYGGAALLLALAAVNATVVAAFAARDSARNHAILRSVGATPSQTVAAFVVAQLGGCLAACAAGIPLGVLLFSLVADDDLSPIRLGVASYAGVALVVVVVYAALVAVPAAVLGRRPVTPVLAYE